MKRLLLFSLLLIASTQMWQAMAQKPLLLRGDQIPWDGIHVGDSVLLGNASDRGSNSAPEQDLDNVFLSSQQSRSGNYWTGLYSLGVLVGLTEDNVFIVEKAEPQIYNGTQYASFYLRHMVSNTYLRCQNGIPGDEKRHGTCDLVEDIEDATSFFTQRLMSFKGNPTGWNINSNSAILAHVKGNTLYRLGPFSNYSFVYYGSSDIVGWNIFRAKFKMPVTKQTVEMTTTKAVGETMSVYASSLDSIYVDWGDGKVVACLPGEVSGTVAGAKVKLTSSGYLTSLDCSNCQLEALNVEDAPNLSTLICANNQLTALNLDQSDSLRHLDCSNNNLTNLAIPQENLLSLDVSNNALTTLPISKLPKLTFLNCSGNKLISLSLRTNPLLTGLWCADNQLSSLTLSYCKELTTLVASRNKLTSVTGSSLSALTDMWVDDNQLTALNFPNFTPKTLNCASNALSALNIQPLTSANKADFIDQSNNKFPLNALYPLSLVKYYAYAPQDTFKMATDHFENLSVFYDFSEYLSNSAGISEGTPVLYNAITNEPLTKGLTAKTCDYFVSGAKIKFWKNLPAVYMVITTKSYTGLTLTSSTFSVGDLTAIAPVKADSQPADGIYYNLLGQPVKNPAKGVYIYNGKKVLK